MRLVAAALFGAIVVASITEVHAEPQPALDRALVERLIRAEESQARALAELVRVTEKCHR